MESGLPAGRAEVIQLAVAVPALELYVMDCDPQPVIVWLPTENATVPVIGMTAAGATRFVTFGDAVAVSVTD